MFLLLLENEALKKILPRSCLQRKTASVRLQTTRRTKLTPTVSSSPLKRAFLKTTAPKSILNSYHCFAKLNRIRPSGYELFCVTASVSLVKEDFGTVVPTRLRIGTEESDHLPSVCHLPDWERQPSQKWNGYHSKNHLVRLVLVPIIL